jgi:hypothetical protein
MDYIPKSDAEIRKLAEDLYRGLIFTDRHVGDKNPDMIKSVFMPIFFLEEKDIKSLKKAKIGLFFEYYDKAGPMSVNGYPTFFSVQMLSEDDTKRLFEVHDKIKSAVENAMNAEKK